MATLYLANVLVLILAGWALWERRLSLHSRADVPITIGIALFALGAALDSPWPGVAAASYPLTGKFFLLMAFGHISYLAGAATGIKASFMRLMPDEAIGPFMRTRIMPMVTVAAPIMLVCIYNSSCTSTMRVDHLYLADPDPWLSVYWIVFVGALIALEMVSIYGGIVVGRDPRSISAHALAASQLVGVLACVLIGLRLVIGANDAVPVLIWPTAYAAIIGGIVASVYSWRQRIKALTGAAPA